MTVLLLAQAGQAAAQVAPPRLVQEDEPDEPPQPPLTPGLAPASPEAAPAGVTGVSPSAATGPGAPATDPSPGAAPGAAAAVGPAVGPPAVAPSEPARKMALVQTSWARLTESWEARRRAYRENDPAGADAAQKQILSAQRELGIENLFPQAAAEVRAVSRALSSNLPAEALARAEMAVSLAPDWPEAHLARARALLATHSGGMSAVLGAAADAVGAAWRDPRFVRASLADVLLALLCALVVASLVSTVLPAASRLPLFLHDFHHLPLLRGTAGIQATFLALALLAIPIGLGLGPLMAVAAFLLCTWLYLSLRERLVASAALLALLGLPWAAEWAVRSTVWTGTLADRVATIEHGALSDEEAAAQVKAIGPDAPAPLLAALGHHMKRRGDLDSALRLYRAASDADPRAAEVLVNIGNVLFLKEDLDGARTSYLAAQDRAEGDLIARGAAAYNLSKLFIRTAEMEKSSAARANAEQMAGAFLAGRGSDEDFSANHYLVDVPVPQARIAALTAGDPAPAAVRASVQRALLPGLPGAHWPWVAGAMLAALWGLSLCSRRLDPVRGCFRCGRPVCRRCDGAAGRSCGQCVNVFENKGVVEARDQLQKEQQVRRHALRVRRVSRGLSMLLGGAGHLVTDAPIRGALFVFGIAFCAFLVVAWTGAAPPPYPSLVPVVARVIVAVPLGVALWAFAVRDAFRRTGG